MSKRTSAKRTSSKPTSSKRAPLLLTALAPALLMTACSGTQNRGLESVHQPIVNRTDYVFDASADGSGLAPGEAQRLAGWMASLRLGYGDNVAVDDSGANAGRARDDVAREIAHYGLLVSDDVPITNAPITPGTVRVVVSRMKASVPGCPDYSRVSQPNFESHTSSNFGCSINSNLAAMVARPQDLVLGQVGAAAVDPAAASKAIDAFRKATLSGGGGTNVKSESTK